MVILNDKNHLTYFAMADTGVPGPLLGLSLPISGVHIVDLADYLEDADGDWVEAVHQAWVEIPAELAYHLSGEIRLGCDDQCIQIRHPGTGVQDFVDTLGAVSSLAEETWGRWNTDSTPTAQP